MGLMFEATHLVGEGWKEEVDVLWRWGTCILAGFVLPSIVDCCAYGVIPDEVNGESTNDDGQAGVSSMVRILAGVLIGDFFHNFCDGIFIGAAFTGCGNSFGWTVTLSTVLHELPQEIADYFILTSPAVDLGRLPQVKALALNFISGMSVLLGAIIVLSSEPDNKNVGMLLAFGAGTYLHIGAVECMPKIYRATMEEAKSSKILRGSCILAFIVGTILIGLILLDHEHCVPEGESGGGHHH